MTPTDVFCGLCVFAWVTTIGVAWIWAVLKGNE